MRKNSRPPQTYFENVPSYIVMCLFGVKLPTLQSLEQDRRTKMKEVKDKQRKLQEKKKADKMKQMARRKEKEVICCISNTCSNYLSVHFE